MHCHVGNVVGHWVHLVVNPQLMYAVDRCKVPVKPVVGGYKLSAGSTSNVRTLSTVSLQWEGRGPAGKEGPATTGSRWEYGPS